MRLNGESFSESYTQRVELPRPGGRLLALTASPLPLAFHRRLVSYGLVAPRQPTRVMRDSTGQPLRDAHGKAVVVPDEEDADYRKALDQFNRRVAALIIAEGLRADERIEFESPLPQSDEDWPAYADGVNRELEDAGWSAGDVVFLCGEILKMSNLVDEHVREAQGNFSSAGRPAS